MYANRKNIDIQSDGTGFSSCSLYLTVGELEDMVTDIQAIMKPLQENKGNTCSDISDRIADGVLNQYSKKEAAYQTNYKGDSKFVWLCLSVSWRNKRCK